MFSCRAPEKDPTTIGTKTRQMPQDAFGILESGGGAANFALLWEAVTFSFKPPHKIGKKEWHLGVQGGRFLAFSAKGLIPEI